MELDEEIIMDAAKRFGISKDDARKQVQELLNMGYLEKNNNPNMPSDLKLTTEGSRFAEKQIIEKFGEFKKIINHRGIAYKVPTTVIIREGIREQDLDNFPLWDDEDQ
jgi:predicted transcriptional regulator